jgi:hypothetical protein
MGNSTGKIIINFAESAERGNVKNLAISFLFVDLSAGIGD